MVEVSTFGGGYTRSPVDVLGVPVPTRNELVTKMMKEGVVFSSVDAVSGGTVQGGDVYGPLASVNTDYCCLYVV